MKKVVLITLSLLPYFVSAQKLIKPEVDELTSDTVWSTSEEKLYMHGSFLPAQGEAVTFEIKKFSNTKTEVLVLHPQSINMDEALSVAKYQKAYLKFADNTIVILTSSTDDDGTYEYDRIHRNLVQNSYTVAYYDLTPADAEKLKAGTLVFLRIETYEGDFDCNIKPKNAAMLNKAMLLIEKAK